MTAPAPAPAPALGRRLALELAATTPPTRALSADEAEVFACEACARPYRVLADTAAAACLTRGCPRLGALVNITDAATSYAAAHGDPNPAAPGAEAHRAPLLDLPAPSRAWELDPAAVFS